jgi:hypothetical protein
METLVATMKKLEIIVKPGKLDAVKKAIASVGYTGITISQAEGHGNQKGLTKTHEDGNFLIELLRSCEWRLSLLRRTWSGWLVPSPRRLKRASPAMEKYSSRTFKM